jgi:hypothetical protein
MRSSRPAERVSGSCSQRQLHKSWRVAEVASAGDAVGWSKPRVTAFGCNGDNARLHLLDVEIDELPSANKERSSVVGLVVAVRQLSLTDCCMPLASGVSHLATVHTLKTDCDGVSFESRAL